MVVGLYADSTLYWLDDALSTANYLICRRCMRLLLDDGDRSFIGDEGGEIRMWQPLAMMYLVSTGSRALSRKTSSRSPTYHEAVILEYYQGTSARELSRRNDDYQVLT